MAIIESASCISACATSGEVDAATGVVSVSAPPPEERAAADDAVPVVAKGRYLFYCLFGAYYPQSASASSGSPVRMLGSSFGLPTVPAARMSSNQ